MPSFTGERIVNRTDPHADGQLLNRGPAPETAAATLVMIHGRGASAASILSLYDELAVANVAAIAPQAAGGTWYPHSFLAPLEANQPYLDSALRRIGSIVDDLVARGVPHERIAFFGFSQGACLTSECIARHPRRYGGVMILTGGVIGPPGTKRVATGSLEGTPVFIGTSDPDAHVPTERVDETQRLFEAMGARVEVRRYPGMPHTINENELEACRSLLATLAAR